MRLILAIALFILSGCAPPAVNLKATTYDNKSQIKSDKTAIIKLQTGLVSGSSQTNMMMVSPGVYIPTIEPPSSDIKFNKADQKAFVQYLNSEINRLGILKVINLNSGNRIKPEVYITLLFTQTHYLPRRQEYILNVSMRIKGSGKERITNYQVLSSEGDSAWKKYNTSASEGKLKAAKKLMQKIIFDIERWIIME